MITYLDTSAAMKLLVNEAESDALVNYLQRQPDGGRDVVASFLLHTELHCAASSNPNDIDAGSVAIVLETVSLIDLTRGDLLTAAALPGRLRSHDAIHLVVALRVGAEEMITYDAELHSAATSAGLSVAQPS